MNDAFAWDVGDLAKFALLRALCGERSELPLGVVWCYTRKPPPTGHGRHVAYLDEAHDYGRSIRARDETLHDLMRRGFAAGRSISSAEYRALLPPGTIHVTNESSASGQPRAEYWRSALATTAGASVVFFDPDNGIGAVPTVATITTAELAPFHARGQSLIVYQHQNRDPLRTSGVARDLIVRLQRDLGANDVVALWWHRYQARLFLVVPVPEHRTYLLEEVRALLASPWGTVVRDGWADFTDAADAPTGPTERVAQSAAAPLSGNSRIEDAAIRFVIEQESHFGRDAQDSRYRGAPADIQSGDRIIEVKAVGGYLRGMGLPLEVRQVEEARTNPKFYVYLVENVAQGDPGKFELRVLGGDQLRRLLARARERRYFEMPLPAGEYSILPRLSDD